jgi:hypothetical protein
MFSSVAPHWWIVRGLPRLTIAASIASPASFHNRDELIRGFESLGYELVDSWQIAEPEHFKIVTCYPDRSVTAYSGLFLRLNEPRNAPPEQGRDDRAAALQPSA